MNFKFFLMPLFCSVFLVSCSQILVRPSLEITQRDKVKSKIEYEVFEKFPTAEEIDSLNQSVFRSKVKLYDPISNKQKVITLEDFSRETLPPSGVSEDYVLAAGDILSISRSVTDLGSNASFGGNPFLIESLEISSAGFVETIDGFKIKVSGFNLRELENFIGSALRSEGYLYQDQIVENQFPLFTSEEYRLGAGDVIQLARLLDSVDLESGLKVKKPISFVVLVEQDGSIQFIELDGRINVSQQTLQEAQDTIQQELLRSGLSTSVTVTVKEYASQVVSITGEFGPSVIRLKPGYTSAERIILSYLADNAENSVRVGRNYSDYLIRLFRGKDSFQLKLSTLLTHSDKDRFTLLDGDRLEVVKINENPKIKVEVEKFNSSFITLTQDIPFDFIDKEKLSYNVGGLGKTLRVFLNDKSISMYDIVSEFGYWPEPGTDNLLILNRDNKNYRFSVNAIIERGQNRAHVVKSGDVIKLERSKIIRDKVYVFGEVGSVESINVSKVNRPYLSEVLESARAFSVKEADIRHIYVLRQENLGKFNAFRFDVSNVLNFGLVEKLEMRPSDIVLVRTLPLYRFNRFINAVFGIGGNAIGSIGTVVDYIEN